MGVFFLNVQGCVCVCVCTCKRCQLGTFIYIHTFQPGTHRQSGTSPVGLMSGIDSADPECAQNFETRWFWVCPQLTGSYVRCVKPVCIDWFGRVRQPYTHEKLRSPIVRNGTNQIYDTVLARWPPIPLTSIYFSHRSTSDMWSFCPVFAIELWFHG